MSKEKEQQKWIHLKAVRKYLKKKNHISVLPNKGLARRCAFFRPMKYCTFGGGPEHKGLFLQFCRIYLRHCQNSSFGGRENDRVKKVSGKEFLVCLNKPVFKSLKIGRIGAKIHSKYYTDKLRSTVTVIPNCYVCSSSSKLRRTVNSISRTLGLQLQTATVWQNLPIDICRP